MAGGGFTAEIEQTLSLLFRVTGAEVLEIRRLISQPPPYPSRTISCFLTPADIAAVSQLIVNTDGIDIEATYITLNPVKPSLLSRAHATFKKMKKRPEPDEKGMIPDGDYATSDADIVCRRLLLVDFDPVRFPKKSCSTDEEKSAAYERALDCRAWLVGRHGWTPPVLCDSGNGFHLLLHLAELPIDETIDRHVSNCLKLLKRKFSDDVVEVDTSVGNPSRITKLYGTWVRKGPSTFERPWRRSCLLEIPPEVVSQ